ncbi:MAG TPA: hypothetical protein VF470_09430, partial [Sphingomicrobium sp.]
TRMRACETAGRLRGDGAGGVHVEWSRRSRLDNGWRDQVDLPLGESREVWRVDVSPPVPGIGAWECAEAVLHIHAATMAALPAGCALHICQVGDFALSPPLSIPLA